MLSNNMLPREFKIFGQIGELGLANKVTFVSLTHPIDSGVKRSYKETEIIDAVIHAVCEATSKRCKIYLLYKLRKILRVHLSTNQARPWPRIKLHKDYILRICFLAKIHADRGKEFENHVMKKLENLCGIHYCRTI